MDSRAEDRLSSLPNDVITIILSFLHTKSAASTSVLSRPWRRLWTQTTALRFNINLSKLVDMLVFSGTLIWASLQQMQTIELNFGSVACTSYMEVIQVMHHVIYNVQSLKELKAINKCKGVKNFLMLPPCVFENKSLEVLDTHGFLLNNVNGNFKLPNLRKLIITVHLPEFQLFEILVSSCPLLEILQVHIDMFMGFQNPVEIKARNLKWLSMHLVSEMNFLDYSIILTIDAPKLIYLGVECFSMLIFSFPETPSGLCKAKFHIRGRLSNDYFGHSLGLALIKPFLRVKSLNLGGDIVLALSCIEFDVPIFDRLTHLELGLSCSVSLSGMTRFLVSCPNLENFVLRSKRSSWDHINWPELGISPILNKIQKIELRNFDGSGKYELKLISYILGFSEELKVLDLTNCAFKENTLIAKSDFCLLELCKLSTKVPNCLIKISSLCCIHGGQEYWSTDGSGSGQTDAILGEIGNAVYL